MEQVPQGGDRVSIAGSAIKTSGTSQYGLVGMVTGQRLDSIIL